jgi:hypothetical protein
MNKLKLLAVAMIATSAVNAGAPLSVSRQRGVSSEEYGHLRQVYAGTESNESYHWSENCKPWDRAEVDTWYLTIIATTDWDDYYTNPVFDFESTMTPSYYESSECTKQREEKHKRGFDRFMARERERSDRLIRKEHERVDKLKKLLEHVEPTQLYELVQVSVEPAQFYELESTSYKPVQVSVEPAQFYELESTSYKPVQVSMEPVQFHELKSASVVNVHKHVSLQAHGDPLTRLKAVVSEGVQGITTGVRAFFANAEETLQSVKKKAGERIGVLKSLFSRKSIFSRKKTVDEELIGMR